MPKPNRNLQLVQSEKTPTVTEELEAIYHEMLRGISLLQVLARGLGDKDAQLQVALEIAAKHLDDVHNRLGNALDAAQPGAAGLSK